MEAPNFYTPFDSQNFSDELCFLCGNICDKRTAEHIFPKWLQQKHNLWNKKLKITNGSRIPYRYLTVPCCKTCNGVYLSQLEGKFKSLLERQFENLTRDEEQVIFQWAAKILYATRYKELSLKVNQSNPSLGNIISPEEIESYSALHLFLQSIRIKTRFEDPKPWSLFIFKCDDADFYYQNVLPSMAFSMKFGEISFSIVFEDNNIIEHYMNHLKSLAEVPLNFAQYLEVNAQIFYSIALKENVPKYHSMFSYDSSELTVVTMGQLRNRDWNVYEFCKNFDYMLHSNGLMMGKSTWNPDGTTTTFLIDEENQPLLDYMVSKKKG